jgi:hypothetical protein
MGGPAKRRAGFDAVETLGKISPTPVHSTAFVVALRAPCV